MLHPGQNDLLSLLIVHFSELMSTVVNLISCRLISHLYIIRVEI